MKYKEAEVLDILKSLTPNGEEILENWNINKSNTPLDLKEYEYPLFVYSFPLIVEGEKVATITLAQLYGVNGKNDLMQKYFGHKDFIKSWESFSHDTYLSCYLTINKDFELPDIVEGLQGGNFTAHDSKGEEFKFTVHYGYPTHEEDSHHYLELDYYFDNDVRIKIDTIKNGWILGKTINQNIEARKRDTKIEQVVNK